MIRSEAINRLADAFPSGWRPSDRAEVLKWAGSDAGAAWLGRFRPEVPETGTEPTKRHTVARRATAHVLRTVRHRLRQAGVVAGGERVRQEVARLRQAWAEAVEQGRQTAARREAPTEPAAEPERERRSAAELAAEAVRLASLRQAADAAQVAKAARVSAERGGLRQGAPCPTLEEIARVAARKAAAKRGERGALRPVDAGRYRRARLALGRRLRELRRHRRTFVALTLGNPQLDTLRAAVAARKTRQHLNRRRGAAELRPYLGRFGWMQTEAAKLGGFEGLVLSLTERGASTALDKLARGWLAKPARQAVVVTVGQRAGRGWRREVVTTGPDGDRRGGGRVVNRATADDAAGAALSAAWSCASRLPCLPCVSRLGRAVRTGSTDQLFKAAYRAAFREASAMPAGFTGRRGTLYAVELDDWGRGAVDEAEARRREAREAAASVGVWAGEALTRSAYRAGRGQAWAKLGCVWPRLPLMGASRNEAIARRAALRRWRVLCLMLRGVPLREACHRVGYSVASSEAWAKWRDNHGARVLGVFGLSASAFEPAV